MNHDHTEGAENCRRCWWNGLTPRERRELREARYEFEQERLAEETSA